MSTRLFQMGLFSKKIKDIITEYLTKEHVTIKEEDGVISFEIYFEKRGFSIYPYIKSVSEKTGELSICANIVKIEELTIEDYKKVNSFNTASSFFKAIINEEKIIYLEYNAFVDSDTCALALQKAIASLFALQDEIDSL